MAGVSMIRSGSRRVSVFISLCLKEEIYLLTRETSGTIGVGGMAGV